MEQQYYQPYNPQPDYRANLPQPNTLVFGILGLALGAIFGIIFGAIGRSKGNAYVRQGGTLTGASKVGYILSKVALILGIITTALIVLMIVLILFADGDVDIADALEDVIDVL